MNLAIVITVVIFLLFILVGISGYQIYVYIKANAIQGKIGIVGNTGIQGGTGNTGAAGLVGPQGAAGVQGTAGTNAYNSQVVIGGIDPYLLQDFVVYSQGNSDVGQPINATLTDCTKACSDNNTCVAFSRSKNIKSSDLGQCYFKQNITDYSKTPADTTWQTYVKLAVRGVPGPTGPQGAIGPPGSIGTIGIQGLAGMDGIQGAIGPQGQKGDTGPQGPTVQSDGKVFTAPGAIIAPLTLQQQLQSRGLITDTCLSTANSSLCNNILTSGMYTFKIAVDGNLLISSTVTGSTNTIWGSGIYGKGIAPYKLYMQSDGNLVEYDANSNAIWSSNTNGRGVAPYKLVMQSTGSAVIMDANASVVWSSNTNGK